jgi:nucleotide-binding universal stress UspA family protein
MRAGVKIARVLCPTDFSEASAHAIELAVVVAGYYNARITALHVLSPIIPSSEETSQVRLQQETTAFFGTATTAGIAVDVLVEVGRPANHILDRAADLPADLVVMGTHGTHDFEHLVLGSVTEKVMRKATCPVLTVPPRAQSTSHLPFKHLLCAIDFSDSSLAALQFARSLAQESDAALTLLHVLEWPWEEPPPPMLEELPREQRFALAEFRRYSEETAKKRLESLVVPDSIRVSHTPVTSLRNGKPYLQILHVAAEEQSDLIVIGVRGRNPVDIALFGSTANQVVRRATCPVLTLRQ